MCTYHHAASGMITSHNTPPANNIYVRSSDIMRSVIAVTLHIIYSIQNVPIIPRLDEDPYFVPVLHLQRNNDQSNQNGSLPYQNQVCYTNTASAYAHRGKKRRII